MPDAEWCCGAVAMGSGSWPVSPSHATLSHAQTQRLLPEECLGRLSHCLGADSAVDKTGVRAPRA